MKSDSKDFKEGLREAMPALASSIDTFLKDAFKDEGLEFVITVYKGEEIIPSSMVITSSSPPEKIKVVLAAALENTHDLEAGDYTSKPRIILPH